MKNISNLILTNFQQWKTGKIEFKPGLNIIIGDTESGKSTLFRAINSILTGKMPEDYIRKGTKGCEVKIEFSDNTIFRRIRNKKDNVADANGLVFERVGKEIPFEYFNKLGKTSIEFGNKELSLCSYSQFEPHFFITLSDYDKSKLIGTICGIDIVDKLMDSINKDIRNNNSNIKFLEQQISEQNAEKVTKQAEFEEVDKKCTERTNLYNRIQNNFNTLENLSNLHQKAFSLNSSINTIKADKNALESKISEFSKDKVELLQKLSSLKNMLEVITNDISSKQELKNNLVLRKFDIDKTNFLDDLYFLKEKLVTCNTNIAYIEQSKIKVEQDIKDLEIKKSELLKDFDKCPLCGGVING